MNNRDVRLAKTEYGVYRGLRKADMVVWKGIPYAAAPEGERRFLPPEKPEPFSGIRDAVHFGHIAWQKPKGKDGRENMAEDCLFLNIWSPAADEKKRPVMVYIHGGSFVKGCGSDPEYDGENLVRAGDVVVVTLNYRLGILGFLDFSFLGEGFAPNCGLYDCTAALKWIAENISAFGGDPERITVFGQSAGAILISALLTVKEAQAVISRAILMSGGPTLFRTKKDGQALARRFMDYTGLDTAEKLKTVPAEILADWQERFKAHTRMGEGTYIPEVDGEFFREFPVIAAKCGLMDKNIPVLMGSTREELSCLYIKPVAKALDIETMFNAGVDREDPALAAEVQRKYTRFGRRGPAIMMSDLIFKVACTWLAEELGEEGNVWLYSFDYETRFMRVSGLHAFHFSDLPFVFANYREGMGKIVFLLTADMRKPREITKRMQADFLTFAKTGSLPWEKCGHGNVPARVYDRSIGKRQLIDPDIRELLSRTKYRAAAYGESEESVL